MQLYELTYLISPKLNQERAEQFSQEINSLVQEQGGILEKIERPKKKTLGYQIKKQGEYFKEAFLSSLNFYLDRKKIESLEQEIAKKQELLRFSLLKKKTKKVLKPLKKIPKSRRELKEEKPKKVELKKIEEKIEEILNE